MRQLAIKKIFTFFHTTSEELDSNATDEQIERFDEELEALAAKYGFHLGNGYTTFYGLEKYSITNCGKCGHLMVNRDKNPAGFSGNELAVEVDYVVYDGGEDNGVALCEECLPLTHRWGHHS